MKKLIVLGFLMTTISSYAIDCNELAHTIGYRDGAESIAEAMKIRLNRKNYCQVYLGDKEGDAALSFKNCSMTSELSSIYARAFAEGTSDQAKEFNEPCSIYLKNAN